MSLTTRVFLTVLIFFLGTATALAQCTVSTTDLAFGVYDFNTNTTSTGNVSVICDTGIGFTIEMSQGNGTFLQRKMIRFEGGEVYYNLYTRADYLEIWGDGIQPGTSIQSGLGSGTTQIFTVFGLVPGSQTITAGNYSDTIIVTVRF